MAKLGKLRDFLERHGVSSEVVNNVAGAAVIALASTVAAACSGATDTDGKGTETVSSVRQSLSLSDLTGAQPKMLALSTLGGTFTSISQVHGTTQYIVGWDPTGTGLAELYLLQDINDINPTKLSDYSMTGSGYSTTDGTVCNSDIYTVINETLSEDGAWPAAGTPNFNILSVGSPWSLQCNNGDGNLYVTGIVPGGFAGAMRAPLATDGGIGAWQVLNGCSDQSVPHKDNLGFTIYGNKVVIARKVSAPSGPGDLLVYDWNGTDCSGTAQDINPALGVQANDTNAQEKPYADEQGRLFYLSNGKELYLEPATADAATDAADEKTETSTGDTGTTETGTDGGIVDDASDANDGSAIDGGTEADADAAPAACPVTVTGFCQIDDCTSVNHIYVITAGACNFAATAVPTPNNAVQTTWTTNGTGGVAIDGLQDGTNMSVGLFDGIQAFAYVHPAGSNAPELSIDVLQTGMDLDLGILGTNLTGSRNTDGSWTVGVIDGLVSTKQNGVAGANMSAGDTTTFMPNNTADGGIDAGAADATGDVVQLDGSGVDAADAGVTDGNAIDVIGQDADAAVVDADAANDVTTDTNTDTAVGDAGQDVKADGQPAEAGADATDSDADLPETGVDAGGDAVQPQPDAATLDSSTQQPGSSPDSPGGCQCAAAGKEGCPAHGGMALALAAAALAARKSPEGIKKRVSEAARWVLDKIRA